METWQATIKEKGNEHLLMPEYCFGNQFDHIKDQKLSVWGTAIRLFPNSVRARQAHQGDVL